MTQLVLGSSSTYRKMLLTRLGLEFEAFSPEIDETPLHSESAEELVIRLSQSKARKVAEQFADAAVIGSDQVASLDGIILGKPGTTKSAQNQLRACSGKSVIFYTGLVVLKNDQLFTHLDITRVQFRALSDAEILRYIDAEQPLNCAGSFKSEGLGASLFDAIDNRDPTALIGLPLIALCRMLRETGFAVP